MSTQFTNRQWRLPNNENKDKQSNYSMDFDGGSNIDTNLDSGSYSSFTISAWIKADTLSSGKVVAAQTRYGNWSNSSWLLYVEAPGGVPYMTFYMMSGGSPILAGKNTVLSINQWYHIVATWDGTTSKVYIDGVKETTEGTVSSMNTSVVNTLIGASHDSAGTGTTGGWDGKLDAVSIFDYALSASQVTTLYGSSSTGIGNPMAISGGGKPVAYYNLGDKSAFNGSNYLVPNSSLKDYVFDFDGSNYIATGTTLTNLSVSTSFSISCWVKITSNVNYDHIVAAPTHSGAWDTGFGLYANGSGIRFWVEKWNQTNQYVATSSLNNGQWYHIGATFDTTNGLKLYVNAGTPTTATGTTIDGLSNTIFIGSTGTSTTYGFIGDLSNTQIWNTELSSSEIETLYNNGSPLQNLNDIPQNSNLQGWWKLDASATFDSSTNTWSIPDDSTNSNDGTSSGMTQANLVQSDLSFTSGYSPYALDFDGANDQIDTNSNLNISGSSSRSFSAWFKTTDSGVGWDVIVATGSSSNTGNNFELDYRNSVIIWERWGLSVYGSVTVNDGNWHHACITYNGNILKLYVDGSEDTGGDFPYTIGATTSTNTPVKIGGMNHSSKYFNGSISNVSIWNTELTSAQVTEIYNEGVPSNLNNHSAYSNLVSWWQLGSNSSFNSSLNQWTCIDEKGTNTGESSQTFAEDAIVDGVGSYANGLSSGMGGDEVIGDAPYSTANALSVNMDVEDRVTDTPS